MRLSPAIGCLAAIFVSLVPVSAFAQNLTVTGSPLPDQPYTLIYPEMMVASGEPGGPLTINHPGAPLQCVLTVVPVEDTGWTAEGALAALDEATVTAGWSDTFPGFVLGARSITNYQSNAALMYEGTSTESPQGGPLTLVHTETVANDNGYTLDCIFATEVAGEARPMVDSIIANFSTEQDATPLGAQ
ncbi:hypothetical protein [Devosia sp. A449]